MKRPLLRTSSLIRSARRIIRKNPALTEDIGAALHLLAENAFHPILKTHKLKGKLEGTWACSAGYDLRIIFEFYSTKVSKLSSLKPSERTGKFIKVCPTKMSPRLGLVQDNISICHA